MHNTLLEPFVVPLCQVSPNCHLAPLLLPQEYILLLAPFAFPLHSHYCMTNKPNISSFCTSLLLNCILSYFVLSPLIFAFFALFMNIPCYQHISPSLPSYFNVIPFNPTPWWLILTPCPTCLPCPHFRFFAIIYACFPATTFLPILLHCMSLFHILPISWMTIWHLFWLYLISTNAFLYLATCFHRLIMFLYMSTVDAIFSRIYMNIWRQGQVCHGHHCK